MTGIRFSYCPSRFGLGLRVCLQVSRASIRAFTPVFAGYGETHRFTSRQTHPGGLRAAHLCREARDYF
jgi:hypothetical protein